MKGKILITDSLFIFPEHEEMLTNAGYEIERLDKPEATEDELVEAIKGKVGYILGGTEKLTDKIIDAADSLKAIAFTGIGYKAFIPNYEYVTQKGIAISNAPNGPTHPVAEWAVTMALAMNRNVFELGRAGDKKFMTTRGIENCHVGIIGLGRIGAEIAKMIQPFKPASVLYYSKSRHEEIEKEFGIGYQERLDYLLKTSDIVFVCVSDDAGQNFIDAEKIAQMKDRALLVSFMHKGIINEEALFSELKKGRIRAVSDYPMASKEFNDLPLGTWYSFNGSNAFNTGSGLQATSDAAVHSLLSLLETGTDINKVN